MWITEAADAAGVNVQTIRYYERRGLLPRPSRRASGYRDFSPEAVRVVRFIKRAQDLGFTLDEISELLQLKSERQRDRVRIRAVAERRLRQVQSKITELTAMAEALSHLIQCCAAADGALECPIIDALDPPGPSWREAGGQRR
jgi:Hg(II)-responsive transcriptional regulator